MYDVTGFVERPVRDGVASPGAFAMKNHSKVKRRGFSFTDVPPSCVWLINSFVYVLDYSRRRREAEHMREQSGPVNYIGS